MWLLQVLYNNFATQMIPSQAVISSKHESLTLKVFQIQELYAEFITTYAKWERLKINYWIIWITPFIYADCWSSNSLNTSTLFTISLYIESLIIPHSNLRSNSGQHGLNTLNYPENKPSRIFVPALNVPMLNSIHDGSRTLKDQSPI